MKITSATTSESADAAGEISTLISTALCTHISVNLGMVPSNQLTMLG